MKNLHLIPTDKPSRLWTNNLRRRLEIDEFPEQHPTNIAKQIFITSDEEIKEGDWCFYLNNLGGGNIVCQAYKHSEDKRMLFDNGKHNRKIGEGITSLMGECKKIILTTDQDLDGVQKIDDEFLEWFVKNSNCESVDVVKCRGYLHLSYMIMIPREEPQQIKCYCGHTTYCDCGPLEEPKQETLEEGVDKYFKLSHSRLKNEQQKEYERELFIAGAKWMQEKMYSKEEVFSLMCKAFEAGYKKYDVVEAGLEGLETEIECNWILKNK